MMLNKRFYLTIFIICGAILFLTPFLSDGNLHLVFCDVGHGDGILIKYKDLQAIIDGGPSGSQMVECLSENIPPWDREVELMILTHPDNDHLAGLIDVLERYDVDQIVVNSIVKESSVFWEFHQRVLAEGAQIYSPQAGDKLKLGPINFLVLWPDKKLGDRRIWLGSGDTFFAPERSELDDPAFGGKRRKYAQKGHPVPPRLS
jgi:beta-lactamase superfamily II metal-dependent hydrolase